MGYDLVLAGKALLESGLAQCEVGVKDGIIRDIKKAITAGSDERLDLGGMLILPSGLDAHVHFRSPGLEAKADFLSESVAAAYGGITTVCDMPNTKPPTTTPDGLKEKLASARGCCVDFGIYAGFEKGQQQRDLDAIARQCIAFKLYMGSSTGNLLVDEDRDIGVCLGRALPWKKPIWVHAEDESMIRSRAFEAKDIAGHYKARPPEAEARAIGRIIALSKSGAVPVHIAHISTQAGLEALKGSPAPATCEVAPHHLLLDISMPSSKYLKVNPPLRTKSDRAALWDALRSGRIDMLASDHAPHTKADKESEFDRCPSGMPGVEAMYPLMMQQMREGNIPLERLVDAIATRPAKILGLRDRGRIAPGLRADLAIFDFRAEAKMTEDSCHYKCGWNPYAGFTAIFPKHVLLKGDFLVRGGNFEGEKGSGRLVPNP